MNPLNENVDTPLLPDASASFLPTHSFGFNRAFFRRARRILGIGFSHSYCSRASGLLYVNLLVLILTMFVLSVLLNPLVGNIMDMLTDPNKANLFESTMIPAAIYCTMGGLGFVVASAAGSLLAIEIRSKVTLHLQAQVLRPRVLHRITVLSGGIDNVDQRLTTDVMDFCEQFSLNTWGTLDGIGSFAAILGCVFSVLTIFQYGFLAYTTVIVIFIVVVGLSARLLGPVSRATYERVREFSECIAFYDGDRNEHKKATGLFLTVYGTMRRLIQVQLYMFLIGVWALGPCNMTTALGLVLAWVTKKVASLLSRTSTIWVPSTFKSSTALVQRSPPHLFFHASRPSVVRPIASAFSSMSWTKMR